VLLKKCKGTHFFLFAKIRPIRIFHVKTVSTDFGKAMQFLITDVAQFQSRRRCVEPVETDGGIVENCA